MNSFYQEYVDYFIEYGKEKLFNAGYAIEISMVDEKNGTTSINLISKTKALSKVVEFAYNRLDYNLEVCVYGLKDGTIDYIRNLLPNDDVYGYMGETMKTEVERLITDICDQLN